MSKVKTSDLISIGSMAKLNCVSVKTLHVYQDCGLLEPRYIDPDSGFRYYSIGQSSTIDAISQLKGLGFSLCDIAAIISSSDIKAIHRRAQSQLDELEHQQKELALKKAALESLTSSCEAVIDKPLCGQISLEHFDERHGLVFDVPEVTSEDAFNLQWEMAVREVKRCLVANNVSLSLFHNVSGIISKDNVLAGNYATYQAIIFVEDSQLELLRSIPDLKTITIPEGSFLTLYYDTSLKDDGTSIEYESIPALLEYAQAHGFEIAGDYIGETLATTPLFSYDDRDSYFRMLLPVK